MLQPFENNTLSAVRINSIVEIVLQYIPIGHFEGSLGSILVFALMYLLPLGSIQLTFETGTQIVIIL